MTIAIAFHASGYTDFQGVLHVACVTKLAWSISQLGELYQVCGTDALVFNVIVLFLTYT